MTMSVANPEAANTAVNELQTRTRTATLDEITRQEALATKRRLEERRSQDMEYVHVEFGSEQVPLEPIAPGRVVNFARRAIEAERAGDEDELMILTDEMIDEFVERSKFPDIFDRPFFEQFGSVELRGAWSDLGQKSSGGNDAGN